MKHYKKWADSQHGLVPRVLLLLLAGGLIVILIPYALLVWLPRMDAGLGLPSFSFGVVNYVIGGLLILLGLVYAWWSIGEQLFKADGTPVPLIPTKKLLVAAPFSHCRNPMTFGTIVAYLGVAIIAGSLFSLLLVGVIAALLILYLKKVEEKELEMRFGQAYLDYKTATPFMIPRFINRKRI